MASSCNLTLSERCLGPMTQLKELIKAFILFVRAGKLFFSPPITRSVKVRSPGSYPSAPPPPPSR